MGNNITDQQRRDAIYQALRDYQDGKIEERSIHRGGLTSPLTQVYERIEVELRAVEQDAQTLLVDYADHADDCQLVTEAGTNDAAKCTCGLSALAGRYKVVIAPNPRIVESVAGQSQLGALEERLRAVEQERDNTEDARRAAVGALKMHDQENMALSSQLAAAKEALKKHGWHDHLCSSNFGDKCSCGLQDAIDALSSAVSVPVAGDMREEHATEELSG